MPEGNAPNQNQAGAGAQAPADAGRSSRIGRAASRLTPGRGALRAFGVLLLVAAALGVVAFIAWGILAARTNYFEQRNLRELDRIATELNTTRESLTQVATLHFVPDQLHFSLSPQLECLIATTELTGARGQPITISYSFTDPAGTRGIAERYARQAATLPGAAPAPPQPAPPPLIDTICQYERPLGLAPDERVTLGNSRIQIERTVPLTDLLAPMTARVASPARNMPPCALERGEATRPITGSDLDTAIGRCFFLAARDDMRDETYSYRDPAQVAAAVQQSIEAAFRSNAVRINASTSTEMLDLDSALDIFDAVQVIAPDARQPLLQAGRVPAAIEGGEVDQTNLLRALGLPAGTPAAQSAQRRAEEQGQFLTESRVVHSGDLVMFQRTLPNVAGLDCNPCRIVGIVGRDKFNQTVRRIDGVLATVFLIGVLTLIGLIPLLQLRLRKRLDPTGRTGQYVLWFSLTLLSASATIAGFAIWSAAASRQAGAREAGTAISQIREAFDGELVQTLALIGKIAGELQTSDSVFPSPQTLPTYAQLVPGAGTPDPRADNAAVRALATAWREGRGGKGGRERARNRAAIIESISYIRGDGGIDRETARLVAGRFPAFGTSLANRAYFSRARNRDYARLSVPACNPEGETQFVMDRVFARPDGAARVIWLMPETERCLQPPREGKAGAAPVAEDKADRSALYDPASRQFLIASGTLRTFLGVSLRPGFRYAVIDPGRPRDAPNVLFHSNPSAEFVERFEQEVDHPAAFRALVRQAIARDERAELQRRDAKDPVGYFSRFRLDTNYRAQPARLTVARLHPSSDWILVVIEDRNDSGYAVWRAATFGYGIWFLGAAAAALALLVTHLRAPRALDRRPGLALWPRTRLDGFTPPRLERHEQMQRRLADAAVLRDRHAWWVLAGGVLGVVAAEGASRIIFAFAAACAMLTARAYFRGETATDDAASRRTDRYVVRTAFVLLAVALVLFVYELGMEYRFRAAPDGELDWPMILLRSAAYSIATVQLGKCVLAARGHAVEPRKSDPPPSRWRALLADLEDWRRPTSPAPLGEEAGPWAQMVHRVRRWRARSPRTDVAWIIALLVLGGLPAAAGFLDSFDQDRLLLAQRAAQVAGEAREARNEAIEAINRARFAKLPDSLIARVRTRPVATGTAPEPASGPQQRPNCNSLSCLAIDYLGLEEQALEFSDFVPYRMADALPLDRSLTRPFVLLITVALPVAALFFILLAFKRLYFRRAPSPSPGKDPDLDPPLSFTREEFVANALLPAAAGKMPTLPFAPVGGNRHLILGAGLDLCDDRRSGGTGRLRDEPRIAWVDLLDPPRRIDEGACVAVVGNLDLALQVPDDGATVRRTYGVIKAVIDWAKADAKGHRHVFLLADTDPLDRIGQLWERQGSGQAGAIDAWRWSELIQDFTLYPIRRRPAVEHVENETRVKRAIREELGLLESPFADRLADELGKQVGKGTSRADLPEEEERIILFIAEQMSDHYHKLWAGSSDEERVMLYRIARDDHLKMRDSRALRSLLARGLLVRVPEYRLMNRSFARYVERVGAASEIRESAERVGGVDWVWPLIRYPLVAIAGASVLLLQFVAPSAASGAVGALPALLALVPTLLGRWFQDRAIAA